MLYISSLNGEWYLHRSSTGETYPATVPGVVHIDLVRAGVIEQPHYRENEKLFAWIAEEDWSYTKTFNIDSKTLSLPGQKLVFEGLDTFASIYLNDLLVGETQNMFRRYELDIADKLRPGQNDLRVEFRSPLRVARELAQSSPYPIPYTGEPEWPIANTHRNLIRKCQCHAGWDWGPAFPTSGIWKDVQLVSFDALKIDQVKPIQYHNQGDVRVDIQIYLDIVQEGDYEFDVMLADLSQTVSANLKPGKQVVTVELNLNHPKLWWPLGYGEPTLYILTVIAKTDDREIQKTALKTGLRQVELVQESDEHGQSFYFRINGVPVFLKGYNWIPMDNFTPLMTKERYTHAVEDAAKANCNLLRVWGGGIYENDAFYENCDAQGILIWQDFMFACAMYPADDAFLANVAGEVEFQIRRLAHHPSIMIWCGNNECEQALTWYPETRANRDRYVAGYHKLYLDTIGRLASQESPDRPFWHSSPSNGPEEYGDPNDPARGDTHYWEVWHGGKPFSQYLTVKPRMSSEFGFQSVPSLETLESVLEPQDMNISSPMMDYRQRSPIGNRAMVEHMMSEYHLPGDFEKFIYLSQVQQGMAMKIACEHWRRLKPFNMGTIIWQLNDIWPGNSWSSVEYSGKWKVLHSFSKRFFSPVLLSLVLNTNNVELWATSDLATTHSDNYTLETRDFSGMVLRSWSDSFTLQPNESRRLGAWPIEQLLDEKKLSEVFLTVSSENSRETIKNWCFMTRAKFCPLPETQPAFTTRQLTDGQTEITLSASKPAFYVWLEIPGRKGIFSDNGFLLLPDHTVTVTFSPRDGQGTVSDDEIRLTHLRQTY